MTDEMYARLLAMPWDEMVEADVIPALGEPDIKQVEEIANKWIEIALAADTLPASFGRQIGILDCVIRKDTFKEGDVTLSDLLDFIVEERRNRGLAV